MSKKIEGDNFVKQAEKCLKTSFMKWSVDVSGAVENYLKAAECYKSAQCYEDAIKYYLKASEMQSNNDSLYYAGKSMEEAATIYRDQKRYKEMTELVLKAGQTYRINGTADSASQLMQRMAKSIEDDAPAEGAKLYQLACQASQDKDNLREAAEFAGLAAKLFVRSRDFESAKEALQNKLNLFCQAGDFHAAGKAVVCLVLIYLHNNDFVGASKVYSGCVESKGFSETQDSSPVNQLLNAVDQGEYDDARAILRGHSFMYLENDFVKLARDLKFPDSASKQGAAVIGETEGGDSDSDDIN